MPTPTAAGHTLTDVVAIFQRWLYMPDPAALYVTLGTVAANRMRGDPAYRLSEMGGGR